MTQRTTHRYSQSGVDSVTWTTEVVDGGKLWLIAFRIEFGRRSHKVSVTARPKGSRTQYRMPHDKGHIVKLLPEDMWPQFAQDFFTQGEESTQIQEGLFES